MIKKNPIGPEFHEIQMFSLSVNETYAPYEIDAFQGEANVLEVYALFQIFILIHCEWNNSYVSW